MPVAAAAPALPSAEDSALLPVMRALVACSTEVEREAARHIESLGLTMAQFDVLAVLGDTEGMSCKELGQRTLITKGTLLPVLARMEARGWVVREKGQKDGRQTKVRATPSGQALYEATFMPHVQHMLPRFDAALKPREQAQLVALLGKLRRGFAKGKG